MTLEHHICALCSDPAHWDRWTLPPTRRGQLVLRFCSQECLAEWEDGEAECKDKEPERRMAGRPRIQLEEWMIESAERLFGEGHSVGTIAQAMGVGRMTAYRWIKEGEEAYKEGDESDRGTLLQLFWDAYIKGRVNTKIKVLGNIIDASKKDWRAGKWWLSVTEPEDYNEQVITARALHELGVELDGDAKPPITPKQIRPQLDAPPPIVKADES